MYIVSTAYINILTLSVAGCALMLYIMRRRVRLGRRKGKF
jgi:hypothetical protein